MVGWVMYGVNFPISVDKMDGKVDVGVGVDDGVVVVVFDNETIDVGN